MKEKFTQEQREELDEIAENAITLHREVNQMYDGKPYGYHLSMVAEIMDGISEDLNPDYETYKVLWFACFFHDSIEDARLTYNDVAKKAMKYMNLEDATLATEIVYALTNEKGRTREERANQKYYEGIRRTLYAPFIKACDRLANVRYSRKTESGMYEKYKSEMIKFISNIDSTINSDHNNVPPRLIELLNDSIL